uniref:POU domain protein n=1 Tax=Anopheles christyi TaxID=43041 RepID=A0A182JUQ8_9DIPT
MPPCVCKTRGAKVKLKPLSSPRLYLPVQDMINLQKLQSLAQLTGANVLGPSLGLPTSPLLGNSPLNLSLSGQNHSPQVLGLGPAAPIAAAAPQMPQLLLASGQIMQGIQGAQLLIPTSQGIATQTILTIPVGQQVISNMSSEALLQSLNFNNSLSETLSSQAAQAAAAAAAAASSGLFATPRDATGSASAGLLSTQLLGSAGGHSLQSPQQHSPKGLHYANHHHHHHHHHGDVKFKPNACSTSSSSSSSANVSGASCLPSVHDTHRQQHHPSGHSLSSSSASSSTLGHTAGGRMTPDIHRAKLQSGESPKRISLITSSPPVSTHSRPASYASCSSSPYDKSMPLKRTLSPPATLNCTTPSSSSGSGHSSNGHLQVNVHSAISATSPRSPSDSSAINRIGLPSGGDLITVKSKLSPAGSSSSGLPLTKDQPSTHPHASVSPLHHLSSSGPSAPGSTGRPGSCDLELIEHHQQQQQQQHHRVPSADELELEKPSTIGSGSGALHQLQKRPHHSAASTPPPKLSPSGSAGRLSHSDDDDDDASNHEFLEEHPTSTLSNSTEFLVYIGLIFFTTSLSFSPCVLSCTAADELTINQTNCNVVDGIDLDDIKEFAKAFKLRRLSLGLTQTQVGQALSVTEGPAYSQSAICRFEKLDITPKSAQKIKPVLERWMKEAEERYKSGQNHVPDFIGVEPSKKRKRRTSFTPQALELLNGHFERNTHPSGTEITGLAHQLGYEREVIRIWFCNKRQALKNTVRMMSKSFKMENT